MKKIIVTGGNKTGALDVVEGLRHAHPEYYFVPSAKYELVKTRASREYPKFGEQLVRRTMGNELQIPNDTEVAILDESLVDVLAHARMKGAKDLADSIMPKIEAAGYDLAFMCEFTGRASIGKISPGMKEAQQHLWAAYSLSGVKTEFLPDANVATRIELVEHTLGEIQS